MNPEQEKDPKATPEGGAPEVRDASANFEKLEKQIESLNKGIATYRDEAKTAKQEAESLKKKLEDFQSKIDIVAEDETVDLHPDDLKKLEAWARKQGLVTKQELEAEKQKIAQDSTNNVAQQAIDEFIAKHKEYEDDANWKKIVAEFQLYKTPSTLAGYRKILDRIHKDLGGEDPEEAEARVKAKQANNSRLSLGGGSQKTSSSEETTVEDLQKKYPNLTREQIMSRIAEIKALYKDTSKK